MQTLLYVLDFEKYPVHLIIPSIGTHSLIMLQSFALMRNVQQGNCEGVVMEIEYAQIRRHAEDKAFQTDLRLRRTFTKTNKWIVATFKVSFEIGFLNIPMVVCPVVAHFIFLH